MNGNGHQPYRAGGWEERQLKNREGMRGERLVSALPLSQAMLK